jgi:corrinoid protein of di/trimethylamine methyltransferase
VGERRFKAPEYVDESDRIFEARYYGKGAFGSTGYPDCAQKLESEDCLYLNIWVNEDDKTEKKPVKSAEKTVSQENTAEKGALFNAIIAGKTEDAKKATQQLIDEGKKPQEIINEQMIVAMSEIGQRFQNGKAFVPQLLMAGRAMKSGLELLKPLMAGSASISAGKVVIGTVKGDLHDIGKNLVASMLEGCGFEVVNIGIDVSADTFIEEVKKNQPDILCMSALLTTTMGYMKEVIDALEAAGIRDQVKVMVGGAPVTQGFADEIGADGYSDNANSAVTVAKQLLGKI